MSDDSIPQCCLLSYHLLSAPVEKSDRLILVLPAEECPAKDNSEPRQRSSRRLGSAAAGKQSGQVGSL
jgi:hypothetical protein